MRIEPRWGLPQKPKLESLNSGVCYLHYPYPEDAALKRHNPSSSHHYFPFDLSDTH